MGEGSHTKAFIGPNGILVSFCSHALQITDELLEKLTTHTMEVRVWDTKDKVAARVRFDRPKAIRFMGAKAGGCFVCAGKPKADVAGPFQGRILEILFSCLSLQSSPCLKLEK